MENDPGEIMVPLGEASSAQAGSSLGQVGDELDLAEVPLEGVVEEICKGLKFSNGAPFFAEGRIQLLSLSVLRALREVHHFRSKPVSLSDLSHHVKLHNLARLVDPWKYPEISEQSRNSLLGYLSAIPGFRTDFGVRQRREAVACHNELIRPLLSVLDCG